MNASAALAPERQPAPPRILVVEDEQVVALDIQTTLCELGYAVIDCIMSGEEAVACANAERPDLILMDIRLDGPMDGIEAAGEILKTCDCPIIFLTAYSSDQTLARAKQAVPFGYLVKPFKANELRCTIEVAIHKHRIDARLREQEHWFSTTLKSLAEAVVATDPAHKVKFLNPAAERMTGWDDAEATGKEIKDILELVRVYLPYPQGAKNDLASRPTQSILISKKGKTVEIDDTTAAIVDDDGTELGQVVVFRDVSEQRRNQEEIRQLTLELEQRVAERTAQLVVANRELAKVSKVKSEFLSAMSHELRTPLNSIIGFSKLFQMGKIGELTDLQRRYIRFISESGDHLLSLINDVLDLSKIEAGKMELALAPLDIDAELSCCIDITMGQARARDIRIEFEPSAANLPLLADPRKVKQVIYNLLSNAVKFTRDGGVIRVRACRVGREEVGIVAPPGGAAHQFPLPNNDFSHFVEISVADTGIGIADPGKIFQQFVQAGASIDPAFAGTGLGLALVKQLVELHGGTVGVSSIPEQGSRFVVWLPWRAVDQAPARTRPAAVGDSSK
jgi:PAS domain S-box-containing protein